MTHLLTPLEPPFPPTVDEILETYPHRDGYLINLFRVFARSPRILGKLGAGGVLDRASPLTLTERELVILRVTARNGCEYEWGVHVTAFAGRAGLSGAQVADTTRAKPDPSLWSEEALFLLEVCDELCDSGRLMPRTKRRFQETYDAARQLEIFAVAGFYHTVSFIANNADMAHETWAARFPGELRPAAGRRGAYDRGNRG